MNQIDTLDQEWPSRERAEGLVVGMLGHELRNPLSAIAALARVTMSRDDLPGDVRERLAEMDRAAQRSLAMITSLLEYSESRWRGSLPTRPVPAEPGVIASRVIDELRVANPDRVIALDVRSPRPFELDPARMEQVLSNLIGNAIVHGAHDAPVEVSIDVCETEALLSVKNRGPGDPARADRVAVPAVHARHLCKAFARPSGRAASGNVRAAWAWAFTSCTRSSTRTAAPSPSTPTASAARRSWSACRAATAEKGEAPASFGDCRRMRGPAWCDGVTESFTARNRA